MNIRLTGWLLLIVLLGTGCETGSETPRASSLTPPAMSVSFTRENCPSMEVQAGMQVSWTNEDTVVLPIKLEQLDNSNTVVGTGGAEVGPGNEFSTVFQDPGTYHFYCSDNEDVFGTITVQ